MWRSTVALSMIHLPARAGRSSGVSRGRPTDPQALAAYAKYLRPVVTTLRELAEDATAARPMYSREYLREEMLKAIRVLEARIDAAIADHDVGCPP
jgi:hypothetical protein